MFNNYCARLVGLEFTKKVSIAKAYKRLQNAAKTRSLKFVLNVQVLTAVNELTLLAYTF